MHGRGKRDRNIRNKGKTLVREVYTTLDTLNTVIQ